MDISTSKWGYRGLAAWFAVFAVILYTPLVLLVVFSFNNNELPVFPLKGFSTHAYQQFWGNPDLKGSLKTSFEIAAVSSVAAVVLGILASIALVRRRFVGKAAAAGLLLSPLVIPYIIFGIALTILFHVIGIPQGLWTVVMGHIVISLPYTILVLVPRLERIDVRLEEAAQDLGAGAFRTFRSITFPLILPAIVSALLVAATASFDEIIIASFVAGDTVTWPIYLFSSLRFIQNQPQSVAVAVIVIAVSIVIVVVSEVGRRLVERRLEAQLAAAEDA
jgi:spermidine/putrescine transport system permease protein